MCIIANRSFYTILFYMEEWLQKDW